MKEPGMTNARRFSSLGFGLLFSVSACGDGGDGGGTDPAAPGSSQSSASTTGAAGGSSASGGGGGSSDGGAGGAGGGVILPASAFVEKTWGYVGCSNTHDTIWGYHDVDSAHLFWPFEGYPIEGQTVVKWADPSGKPWMLFEQMKETYNAGEDPPVIWIQMCVNLNTEEQNYAPATYDDVVKVIENVRSRAPTSYLFVSPLQDYDPVDLCPKMGPGGVEIPQMTAWLNTAIEAGLAYAGPGTGSNPNLGPLTVELTVADHCHPTGGPHGPGNGAAFLGQQLADFFDHLPSE
jgi:hypothetical protein